MTWQESEVLGLKWVVENFDKDAFLVGGSNSVYSDIFSPKINAYIEIKKLPAQCGQFVESTCDNDYARRVVENPYNELAIRQWIEYHYTEKKVAFFLLFRGADISMMDIKTFVSTLKLKFSCTIRKKKSGTAKAPKNTYPSIKELLKCYEKDGKIFAHEEEKFGQYFEIKDITFFVSKNTGEIRKCSSTNNTTYIMEVIAVEDN